MYVFALKNIYYKFLLQQLPHKYPMTELMSDEDDNTFHFQQSVKNREAKQNLTIVLLTFGNGYFFAAGGSPMHYKMFSIILDLFS